MALTKNLSLMGITAAVRLGTSLFAFSVLARLLGPEAFGVLMLWFSVSALLALVTNFGLTPYVLREIGANPATAETVINEGITIKLLLAALLFSCAVAAACFADMELKGTFLLLLVAAVADSFTEFLNAGFRARNRFDIETRIAGMTALSHAAIVAGFVFVSPTVPVAALAYAVSRLLVLAVTIPAVVQHFAPPRLARLGPSLARVRGVVVYAIDFGFQSLFGNIDSVIINHFVGPAAVGLYQAGMRVFRGGTTAAQVLASVFLPRAAGKAKDFREFETESNRIQIVFLSFGALFGMLMAILSESIVRVLFGTNYSDLAKLFPFFGVLFFVRFAVGAWGVVLTAAGEQRYRTMATIAHWGLIAGTAPALIASFGVAGWLISMIAGNALLGFLYALRGARRVSAPWLTVGMTLLGGLSFVPFLHVVQK